MTKITIFTMVTVTVLSMFLISCSFADGSTINVVNKCGQALTVCDAAGTIPTSCYVLNGGGGSRLRDVGALWDGGLIWGFPGTNTDPGLGNSAKPQANKVEMTIGKNGPFADDSYNLSNVDAYNLPLLVNPTFIARGGVRDGHLHCETPICQIPNLSAFCQSPNFLTGFPGFGCKNADGPGEVATAGTRRFKDACMSSYSYSKDDATHNPGVVYGCETGSNYEVVFCP